MGHSFIVLPTPSANEPSWHEVISVTSWQRWSKIGLLATRLKSPWRTWSRTERKRKISSSDLTRSAISVHVCETFCQNSIIVQSPGWLFFYIRERSSPSQAEWRFPNTVYWSSQTLCYYALLQRVYCLWRTYMAFRTYRLISSGMHEAQSLYTVGIRTCLSEIPFLLGLAGGLVLRHYKCHGRLCFESRRNCGLWSIWTLRKYLLKVQSSTISFMAFRPGHGDLRQLGQWQFA